MALKAFIKDLSDVDEGQQGLYKKTEFGFVLDVASENGYALENISGLTSTLEKQKKEISDAKNALRELGDLSPDEIKRKLERYDKIKDLNEDQIKKQVTESVKEQARAEFQDEIKRLSEVIKTRDEGLKSSQMANVLAEIKAAGGVPELAESYINRVVKVDIDNTGKTSMKIFRDDGQTPRIKVVDGQSVDYSTKDLISDLQSHEVYGKIFSSKAQSGTGDPNYKAPNSGELRTITREQAESGEFNEEIAAGKVNVSE